MRLNTFDERSNIINSNLSLTNEEGVQSVCPASLEVLCGNLTPYKQLGEKAQKCTKGNTEKNVGCNGARQKRTSWIR